ncbi:hypothetical protein [Streptomyces sp. Isolate_219]|uniref:hypothetical protein n=1 Tax=Streptomyces sp. Isolate_219 TaxID=2950110 RepID=UPI0021C69910|nr:hypothetical protein [Streptomyces sp. Isolate_219]MCR8574708.1 hypothetical protein [Streptomyces sp. Isolate_219]
MRIAMAMHSKVEGRLRATIAFGFHSFAAQLQGEQRRSLIMDRKQSPIPDEVMSQSAAYRLMNVTRAMFRGYLDRGEIRAVDYLGARGSARVLRSDVLRLMSEKGMEIPEGETQQITESMCRNLKCLRTQADNRRLTTELAMANDAYERAKRALDAVVER